MDDNKRKEIKQQLEQWLITQGHSLPEFLSVIAEFCNDEAHWQEFKHSQPSKEIGDTWRWYAQNIRMVEQIVMSSNNERSKLAGE